MAVNLQQDTIVARATPAGRGGVGIIRISGIAAGDIAVALLGRLPKPRYATYSGFRDTDGTSLDSGIALWFPGPHSFTGEDVLEIQGHGGAVVIDLLLERITALGARLAEPGEFSKRAFLNDKLDLTQAEAIVDLIDSGSRVAARAAQRSLQGEFSRAVMQLNDRITELRVHVEAAIDFPDEDIDFLSDSGLLERVSVVDNAFSELTRSAREGCLLREGATLVLAGKPNAGKSSLLNALSGYSAAIVTDVPGTTRDVIKEHIDLDGLPLSIVDTAGLRSSTDVVEQEGVRRTHEQLRQADLAILVIDVNNPAEADELIADMPLDLQIIKVLNKCDLINTAAGIIRRRFCNLCLGTNRRRLRRFAIIVEAAVGLFALRKRQHYSASPAPHNTGRCASCV